MSDVVYRDDKYAYEILMCGKDVRVKILLGPFSTESNVPEGKHHHILGLSHQVLREKYERDGAGPHVHTITVPIGPAGAVFQPNPDKPSR